MDFQPRHKISAGFNIIAIVSVVFLVLTFFVLISGNVTPSGMPVNLSSATHTQNLILPNIQVTITKDLHYFINDKEVKEESLTNELRALMTPGEVNTVILNVDKEVPAQYFVTAADAANSLGMKVSLATVKKR